MAASGGNSSLVRLDGPPFRPVVLDPTATAPIVTVNNTSATVYGAALAPGSAGLYQIAIQVLSTLADGDWPIQAMIGGILSPAGTILTVHQ